MVGALGIPERVPCTRLAGPPIDFSLGPPNCLGGPGPPSKILAHGPLGPWAHGPRVLEARVLEVQSVPWAHRPKGPMPLGPPWAQNFHFLKTL